MRRMRSKITTRSVMPSPRSQIIRFANSSHMAEEERDNLPDFRRYAGLQRATAAEQFRPRIALVRIRGGGCRHSGSNPWRLGYRWEFRRRCIAADETGMRIEAKTMEHQRISILDLSDAIAHGPTGPGPSGVQADTDWCPASRSPTQRQEV